MGVKCFVKVHGLGQMRSTVTTQSGTEIEIGTETVSVVGLGAGLWGFQSETDPSGERRVVPRSSWGRGSSKSGWETDSGPGL